MNKVLGSQNTLLMDADCVHAERSEAPSACIYGYRQQYIKSLKMVVQTSDETNFLIVMSRIHLKNDPTMTLFDSLFIGQYNKFLIQDMNCAIKSWLLSFIVWKLCAR